MSRVDKLLARFPGPVTLYPGRLKWFGYFGISFAFAAAGLYYALAGHLDAGDTIMAWLSFICFGGAALFIRHLMSRRVSSLTLTADGFEGHLSRRRVRASWREVCDFGVDENPGSLDGGSWLPDRLVDFRIVAPGLPPDPHPGPDTRRATLPDTYGLGARKLAELMNAWRALALAKDTRAHPWG